jgi:hypothetical protein
MIFIEQYVTLVKLILPFPKTSRKHAVYPDFMYIFTIRNVNFQQNFRVKFSKETMNKFQKETLKKRIVRLARMKSTGAPAELAFRLEISERSVKRFVKEIREEGTDIRYSQTRMSYVTEDNF